MRRKGVRCEKLVAHVCDQSRKRQECTEHARLRSKVRGAYDVRKGVHRSHERG